MESKPVDRGSGYTLGSGRSGEDGGGQGQVAQTLAVALCVASLFLFLDVRWGNGGDGLGWWVGGTARLSTSVEYYCRSPKRERNKKRAGSCATFR